MFRNTISTEGSPAPSSVYQRALGEAFSQLAPGLRTYFGPIPGGSVGRGEGVFSQAGYCGPVWLRPLLRIVAGRQVLFPEFARDVPFIVVNRTDAAGVLRARRDFLLPRAPRRMTDAMTAAGPGVIVDRLGRRGGLEVRLRASVVSGGMRLASTALAVRVAGIRIPLPPVAGVVVTEHVDDRGPRAQRVAAMVRVALLGDVFRYEGTFDYRIVASDGKPAAGVGGAL